LHFLAMRARILHTAGT